MGRSAAARARARAREERANDDGAPPPPARSVPIPGTRFRPLGSLTKSARARARAPRSFARPRARARAAAVRARLGPLFGFGSGARAGSARRAGFGAVSVLLRHGFARGDFLSTHTDALSGSCARACALTPPRALRVGDEAEAPPPPPSASPSQRWVLNLADDWARGDGGALRFSTAGAPAPRPRARAARRTACSAARSFPRARRSTSTRSSTGSSCSSRGRRAVPHQVVRVSGAGADRRPRFGLTGWYFTPDDHFSAGELRQVALAIRRDQDRRGRAAAGLYRPVRVSCAGPDGRRLSRAWFHADDQTRSAELRQVAWAAFARFSRSSRCSCTPNRRSSRSIEPQMRRVRAPTAITRGALGPSAARTETEGGWGGGHCRGAGVVALAVPAAAAASSSTARDPR